MYIYTYICKVVYSYIYIYIYVCVCVCVCLRFNQLPVFFVAFACIDYVVPS